MHPARTVSPQDPPRRRCRAAKGERNEAMRIIPQRILIMAGVGMATARGIGMETGVIGSETLALGAETEVMGVETEMIGAETWGIVGWRTCGGE